MTQAEFTFADPKLDEREKPRLSGQCLRIVERLRQGPATNQELACIALKYTSRISDLRKSGYAVRVLDRDHETGLVTYELVAPTEPVKAQ